MSVDKDKVETLCSSLELDWERCRFLEKWVKQQFGEVEAKYAERPVGEVKEKVKRKPSRYQTFMGECIRDEIKIVGSAPEAMKKCAPKWKREKERL